MASLFDRVAKRRSIKGKSVLGVMNLHEGTIRALCRKFREPGFFTQCAEWARGKPISRVEGFCAKLHKECTGYWPAEDPGGKR